MKTNSGEPTLEGKKAVSQGVRELLESYEKNWKFHSIHHTLFQFKYLLCEAFLGTCPTASHSKLVVLMLRLPQHTLSPSALAVIYGDFLLLCLSPAQDCE